MKNWLNFWNRKRDVSPSGLSQEHFGPVFGKQHLYWLCQIGGWSLYATYLLVLYSSDGLLPARVALDTIFTTICLMLISHGYRYIIHRLNWLRLVFAALLPRMVLASVLLSIAAIPLEILSSTIFNPHEWSGNNVIAAVIVGAFLYFSWSLGYFLYHYINSYNQHLKWEATINEFELSQLKSQLNPHFIFNALNTVKALVDEDPNKAKDSIFQLSNILRNSLMMDKKKVIPFDEEMSIVRDYLALEGTRFEERLRVEYDIDMESWQYKVPPMMLQTLVENAIKHGISRLKNGGVIQISTRKHGDKLHIVIRNTGHYQPGEHRPEGVGLRSTRQRLALLYHKQAGFDIANEGQNTVRCEVILPKWDDTELTV